MNHLGSLKRDGNVHGDVLMIKHEDVSVTQNCYILEMSERVEDV